MSSKSRHINWGEWLYDNQQGLYYREGRNKDGKTVYETREELDNPRYVSDVPDPNVEDIGQSFGNVNIQDQPAYYTHTTATGAADFGTSPPAASSSKGKGKAPAEATKQKTSSKGQSKLSSSSKPASSSKSSSRREKDKGKGHGEKGAPASDDPFYAQHGKLKKQAQPGEPAYPEPITEEGDDPTHYPPAYLPPEGDDTAHYSQDYPAAEGDETGHYPQAYAAPGPGTDTGQFPEDEPQDHGRPPAPDHGKPIQRQHGVPYGGTSGGAPSQHHPEDEFQAEAAAGEAYHVEQVYVQHQAGGGKVHDAPAPYETQFTQNPPIAQTDPYDDSAAEDAEMQAAMATSRGIYQRGAAYPYGESSTAQESEEQLPYVAPDEDDGQQTPRPGSPTTWGPDIRGTGGNYEALDPRYVVAESKKFAPGAVFKILWSEPQGSQGRGNMDHQNFTELEERTQFGQRFYVGFRRFIVVANDEGHCTCVPILTYGGKGCKKKGVKPRKHGVVYQSGHKPRLLDGEPDLGFKAVAMSIKAKGEKLSKESRANYSKLVTIEHNVKVFFVGKIAEEDFDVVSRAVDKCWAEKIRKQTKGEHQQTEQFQQKEHQPREYQQAEPQQAEYPPRDYQQTEYRQTERRQTEHRQTEHRQTEHRHRRQ